MKYIVQLRKNNRWVKTFWTRKGLPVSKRAIVKAVERAKRIFPTEEYRAKFVKE